MRATIQLWILRIAGVLGAALFGFFFVLTFSTPQWVEQFAVEYIEARVSEKVHAGIEKLPTAGGTTVAARVAENLLRRNEVALGEVKHQLESRVRDQWEMALAEVRDVDCECRKKWSAALESVTALRVQSLEAINQRLTDFIQANYMEVATDLKRDIRIFTATNAGVFLLLVLISFLKPRAVRHLFVPGLLLCVATLCCAYGYVFEQNWLLTVINGSYLGFAYAFYLGTVFLFLCDIALNRGRVTTWLVNGLADAVGSSASLIPC